jgi:hypothetical protein
MTRVMLVVAVMVGLSSSAKVGAQPEEHHLETPPAGPTPDVVPLPPLPTERRRPFEAGTQQLGLILGIASGGGDTAFSLGGSYGYYVLPGLAPGLQVVGTGASKSANTLEVSPYLRYVLYRSWDVSPFVIGKAGRLFVGSGLDDLTILGGGGGIVWFLSQRIGLQLTGLYEVYLPEKSCGTACEQFSLGAGIGFFP